jgi:hypothetical protein
VPSGYSTDVNNKTFKESKMTNTAATAGQTDITGKISLEMLSKLTGFPIELIKEEVFKNQNSDEVSIEELRAAMLSYIDSSMLSKT